MFPPVRNPSTQSAAPKFGEKDLIRRSASTVTPPAQRQTEVAKLIDVSKCIGCKACQTACLEWNQLHEDIGVNVGVYDNPHEFALTYGMTDWVRNVLHAGGGLVIYRGRTYRISDPELVPGDAEATRVPKPVRMILDALDADQRMLVHADLT